MTTRPPNGRNENGFIVFDVYRVGKSNAMTCEVAESEALRIIRVLKEIVNGSK